MSEPDEPRWAAECEIRSLQTSIEQTNVRRAAQLSLAEKLKLGADLFDDGIRWLRQIIQAEQPAWDDEQVNRELDRRKAVQRRIEEAGFIRPYVEDALIE